MKLGESEVSSGGNVIGKANYPVFDSMDEAVTSKDGYGEEKCLDLLNSQIKTNAMNEVRTAATKGPTKSALRSTAMNEIVAEITNGEHQNVIGNEVALNNLITKRMDELEERAKEVAASFVASGAEEGGE